MTLSWQFRSASIPKPSWRKWNYLMMWCQYKPAHIRKRVTKWIRVDFAMHQKENYSIWQGFSATLTYKIFVNIKSCIIIIIVREMCTFKLHTKTSTVGMANLATSSTPLFFASLEVIQWQWQVTRIFLFLCQKYQFYEESYRDTVSEWYDTIRIADDSRMTQCLWKES